MINITECRAANESEMNWGRNGHGKIFPDVQTTARFISDNISQVTKYHWEDLKSKNS